MAQAVMQALGFGGATETEIQLKNRLQELVLVTHGQASENVEARQRLAELEARGRIAAVHREQEMLNLRSMISSLQNNYEKREIERNHKQLLLERDANQFAREIDLLRSRAVTEQMIQNDKMNNLHTQYNIDKAILNERDIQLLAA